MINSEIIPQINRVEIFTLRLQWTQINQHNQVVPDAGLNWEGRTGTPKMLPMRLHALSAGNL